MHKQFYTELETVYFVQKKTVKLEYPGEYSNVVQEINARGWGIWKLQMKLLTLT